MNNGKPLAKIALEVVLIGLGVFLALFADQWRENAQHRESAQEALRRFRTEIGNNRDAVAAVREYHTKLKAQAEAYLPADAATRKKLPLRIDGVRWVTFEHTAWDLAVATQALTHIDRDLAFALSEVYSVQRSYAELTSSFMQTMYLRPSTENLDAFLRALLVYYGDIVLIEPKLLTLYDQLAPALDRAISVPRAAGQ